MAKGIEPGRDHDLWWRDDRGAIVVAWIEHDERGGRVEPTGVYLRTTGVLTRKVIDGMPWAELVELGRPTLDEVRRELIDGAVERGVVSPANAKRALALVKLGFPGAAPRRGGRSPITKEHLQRVADVYSEAWRNGKPTTQALLAAEELNISSASTANKHVERARREGFLPATEAGVAKGKRKRAEKATAKKPAAKSAKKTTRKRR